MSDHVVTVTGTGSESAPVDQVVVNLGVQEEADDAGAAFEAAARTSSAVLAVLADHGVDSRSVRTTDLTLGPRTEWRDSREHVLGYRCGQRLVIRLDGIGTLGRLLTDAATQVGNGVRIEGLEFQASDLAAARRRARDTAWADAWAQASQYAALAGAALGAVLQIVETPHGGPVAPLAKGRMMAASADMPISAGDTQISLSVSVTWQLLAG